MSESTHLIDGNVEFRKFRHHLERAVKLFTVEWMYGEKNNLPRQEGKEKFVTFLSPPPLLVYRAPSLPDSSGASWNDVKRNSTGLLCLNRRKMPRPWKEKESKENADKERATKKRRPPLSDF